MANQINAQGQNQKGSKRDRKSRRGRLLKDYYPELAAEVFDPQVDLGTLACASHKKVTWKCSKCGHVWSAAIYSRTAAKNPSGCPRCVAERGRGGVFVKGSNDLETKSPELAKEWSSANSLNANEVAFNSNKKTWWICPVCGSDYQASPNNRQNGTGCPVCAGKQVRKEVNDLASQRPDIAKDWSPENSKKADELTVGADYLAKWNCPHCGKTYEQYVYKRTGKKSYSCPECSRVQGESFPELALWFYIRRVLPDACHRGAVGNDEVDILLPSIRTTIEYDGWVFHRAKRSKDTLKKKRIQDAGYAAINVIEVDEKSSLPALFDDLGCESALGECLESGVGVDGENLTVYYVPAYVDGERYGNFAILLRALYDLIGLEMPEARIADNRLTIMALGKREVVRNSLAERYPGIAADWDFEKNGGLTPEEVLPASNVKVFWKCQTCGYEWEAVICSRTAKKPSGCPACAARAGKGGSVIQGVNDIESQHPEYMVFLIT